MDLQARQSSALSFVVAFAMADFSPLYVRFVAGNCQ
jgi:hypothetical protein